VRIGVNTGEVVAGDVAARQAFASGDAVNVAARLEQSAAPGEVLIGEATLRLVRDAVVVEEIEPLALKGKSEPVPAWRLLEVTGRAGILRRLDAPLIGRTRELERLVAAWRATVDEGAARLLTVAAPAGAGKTRLLAALADAVHPHAEVLTGSCLAYGEGITYWPIAEAIRAAAGIDGDDSADEATAKLAALLAGEDDAGDIAERLAPALGLLRAGSGGREETFWAVRRLVEVLARRRPLVFVLDDLHWAEETLLELIEYLARGTHDAALLLVCATRPELLERRALAGDVIALAPLGADDAGELMLWQLGSVPLPATLRETILTTSEGNPLFVQELVRMLIEEGLVARDNGGWRVARDIDNLALPPTIQALLAARLDQLGASERDVAQRASVVGQVFTRNAVHELCDVPVRDELGRHLQTLVRADLISPEAGATDDNFRFGHILVRDAAYAGLAKRTRAELHERLASWTEAARSGRLTEYEEILGYHLEQAASYSRELGLGADAERAGLRASVYLAAAGRRALASADFPAAANLLARAVDALPAADPQRPELQLEAIAPLAETGAFDRAMASLEEIVEHAPSRRLSLAARAWRAFLRHQIEWSDGGEVALEDAREWLIESERSDDHSGQATALGFLAKLTFWEGQAADAELLCMRAVEQAELAGDKREESESLVWLLIAGMFGPTPVDAALARCDAIASRRGVSLKVQIMASIEHGVLEAMQGHIERGRERVAEGRRQLEALGLVHLAAVMGQEAATIERLAGDPAKAEAILRPGIEAFERMGDAGFGFTHLSLLGRALHDQGRFEDAARITELLVERLDANPALTDESVTGVIALTAARAGDDAEALRLATTAVERESRSDYLRDIADRYVDLADVQILAGRRNEALAALVKADGLYERKGCVAAMRWTAKRRAELAR
jgi:tetratricopeptide (TPR) repeat protein